jgi:hypothetical protein
MICDFINVTATLSNSMCAEGIRTSAWKVKIKAGADVPLLSAICRWPGQGTRAQSFLRPSKLSRILGSALGCDTGPRWSCCLMAGREQLLWQKFRTRVFHEDNNAYPPADNGQRPSAWYVIKQIKCYLVAKEVYWYYIKGNLLSCK